MNSAEKRKASLLNQVAVDDILACADREGRSPTRIPSGFLAERVATKGGHTTTSFYGSPSSWMTRFMTPGNALRGINRFDSNGQIIGKWMGA